MRLHTLKVLSPNGTPLGTEVFLDGVPLEGVLKVEFAIDIGNPRMNVATITLFARIDAEVGFDKQVGEAIITIPAPSQPCV